MHYPAFDLHIPDKTAVMDDRVVMLFKTGRPAAFAKPWYTDDNGAVSESKFMRMSIGPKTVTMPWAYAGITLMPKPKKRT